LLKIYGYIFYIKYKNITTCLILVSNGIFPLQLWLGLKYIFVISLYNCDVWAWYGHSTYGMVLLEN